MLSVGACKLINGKVKLASYSARCEHLDFVSFSGIDTEYDKNINGTSFSAPLLAGMVALIQCYFLQTKGRKLTYDELLEYLIKNSVDLGDKDRDDKYGHGLLVLPSIEESEEEIRKYQNVDEVPAWGKDTIEKLIKKEVLKGDENGNLNMSDDLLRTLVIHDRLGLYD